MLAIDGSSKQAAQGLAPTTLRAHARSQRVGLAERRDRTATLVASARPHVANRLAWQWSDCALMLEAVAMFVRTLAAGVVAI